MVKWQISICFSEVVEGDSGSIVYFVGKKNDERHMHYPWGMLVQSETFLRPDRRSSFTIYYAVVLEQVLIDIARDYRSLFTNLKLFSLSHQTREAEVQQPVNATGGPRPPK